MSAEVGPVAELDRRLAQAMQLEHDQLVLTAPQQGGRQIQRALRAAIPDSAPG